MIAPSKRGVAFVLAAAATLVAGAHPVIADDAQLEGDAARAERARDLTLALSVTEAQKELEGASETDPLLTIERARAALYARDCEKAALILERQDPKAADASALLAAITKGCLFTTSGTLVVEDVDKGVWIRFQDDEDRVLAPRLIEVAVRSRELFQRELGVELPRPIRIELVRDQLALSMMTGLPWEAAKTTGTIGVAKWGAVIMVSPRGAPRGYNFVDTLAHELSHLAQTRGSKDRAPLWVQEGVARMLETKWREPWPLDEMPPSDAMAYFGIKSGIGPEIDKIGASIALLPSAEEAQVTYAKVQSFMGYWRGAAGDGSLGRLLAKMGEAAKPDDVEGAIAAVSNETFATWNQKWKEHLEATKPMLAPEDRPDAPLPKGFMDVRRNLRLGQLFLDRGHAAAARITLEKAAATSPKEASVRGTLALSLAREGKNDEAKKAVEDPLSVDHNHALFWAMRARFFEDDRQRSLDIALSLNPYDPEVACDGTAAPDLPKDERLRDICEAARRKPR